MFLLRPGNVLGRLVHKLLELYCWKLLRRRRERMYGMCNRRLPGNLWNVFVHELRSGNVCAICFFQRMLELSKWKLFWFCFWCMHPV